MTSSRCLLSSPLMFVIVCVLFAPVQTYNFLMLPVVGKSHVFSMVAIANSLVARNHSVTVVVGSKLPLDAPESDAGQRFGVRYERFNDSVEDYDALYENITMPMLENQLRMDEMLPIMKTQTTSICRQWTFGNEPLFERLAAAKFDLVIVDGIFFMKCIYLVPHRLQLPFVTYADVIDPLLVRVPWLPSFVPASFMTSSDRMSFFERLQNTGMLIVFSFYELIPDSPKEVFDDYQRYGSFRTLDDIMAKSLLWLITTEHVLDYPKPTMPHVVNIGGLTVQRKTGDLSTEFRSFVDGAERGVIIVSFGSMVPRFPHTILEKFLDVFKRLDKQGYRIIWRLKSLEGFEKPNNVLIKSWIPQNDLLGHPKVKLFITHCGNNGQYEALYHGVPMIGFPLMGDQERNAKRLTQKGYGLTLNIFDFSADQLFENIKRVVDDRSFGDRMRRASEIFRSAPSSPADVGAYWIEHVARFGGEHLRSGGHDLPLYAYLMLDVVAFVLGVVGVVIFVVVKLIRFARNILTRQRVSSSASGKIKAS